MNCERLTRVIHSRAADKSAAVPDRRGALAGYAQIIELVVAFAGKAGLFEGRLGNETIVRSRQPFLDGARVLLARGYGPATPYNMRHANSSTLSFVTTTLGRAAGLSVNADRTRFQKFVPFAGPIKEAAE